MATAMHLNANAKDDYRRGWAASARASDGALDRADSRGEPDAWYDGYLDNAVGRPMYHTLACDGEGCQEAEHPIRRRA